MSTSGWKPPRTFAVYWAERKAKYLLQPLWWRLVKRAWYAIWSPR